MLTGSEGVSFHGFARLPASYVRTGLFIRDRLIFCSYAEGAARRRLLLLRQGAQPAQCAVLGHPDGAW